MLFLLAACAGVQPAPSQPSAAPAGPTVPAVPTRTLTPVSTETSRPTITPAFTQTAAPAPAGAASPYGAGTPDPALGQVKLLGLAWMKNYNMLLSFQFPGPVEPDRYTVKVENKLYPCQKLDKFPDRLYCIGPGVKVLTTAQVQVYPVGASQPGFEKEMWIPFFDNQYSGTVGDNLDEDYSKMFNP